MYMKMYWHIFWIFEFINNYTLGPDVSTKQIPTEELSLKFCNDEVCKVVFDVGQGQKLFKLLVN